MMFYVIILILYYYKLKQIEQFVNFEIDLGMLKQIGHFVNFEMCLRKVETDRTVCQL